MPQLAREYQADNPNVPELTPRPCEYFDLICGTSIGGLIALMLGRLRMSVEEGLQAFISFGTSVFGHSRWFHERSVLFLPRSKYATRRVRRAILTVIRDKLNKSRHQPLVDYRIETEPLESPDYMCRTCGPYLQSV